MAGTEGAGVNILCDRIVEAWKRKRADSDNVFNTLKVDFKQSKIAASAIARLIAEPDILPPSLFGGFSFQNVELIGALILDQTTVEVPVTFFNAHINGTNVSKKIMGLADLNNVAISLNAAHFKHRLIISQSTINGSIFVGRGKFDRGFFLFDSNIGAADRTSYFAIVESTIQPILLIDNRREKKGVSHATMAVVRSKINTIEVSGGEYHQPVIFENNFVDNLLVSGVEFRNGLILRFNKFSNVLEIIDVNLLHPKEVPRIQANSIGSKFSFVPLLVNPELANLDLSYNTLTGQGFIDVPFPWNGTVNLKNFRAGGVVRLRLSRQQEDTPTGQKLIRPMVSVEKFADDFQRCDESETETELIIDLDGANFDNLVWGLGVNCSTRWRGEDFRFREWSFSGDVGVPNKGGATLLDWASKVLAPKKDALTQIANNLVSHGEITESRTVREEAKRLNYVPPEGAKPIDGMYLGIIRFFLSPSGYGAKPENAALYLVLTWLGGTLFYGFYLWRCEKKKLKPGEKFKLWETKTCNFKVGKITGTINYCRPNPLIINISEGHFKGFGKDFIPQTCSIFRYSLDAVVPMISLHAYDRFFGLEPFPRVVAVFQHLFGWWFSTVLLASLTVLQ